ncbi:MAG: glycosyltransferase, partial [Lachnospiraceae bacterium]|nr:glycosyltransferase [Lachnospiraceae bacterium]
MNILLVHCRYRIAGGEDEVVSGDRKLLEKMGHTVHTLYKSNEELDSMGAAGRLRSTLGYVYSASTGKEYVKLIRGRAIDAVWVHNTMWMIGGAIYEAAAECDVPVIQTIHNYRMLCPCGTMYRNGKICRECLHEGLHKAIIHRCYRGSGILSLVLTLAMMRQRRSGIYRDMRFVCLTDLQKKMLLETDIGIRDDRVYIKRNHCETPMRWIPYDERKNCFVYAGRLAENKGIRELLEAWRRLEKEVYIKHPENCPQLVICGDGELADYVSGYIRENGLNYVNYVGKIQRDRLAGILSLVLTLAMMRQR